MQPFVLRDITIGAWRPWIDHPDKANANCADLLWANVIRDIQPRNNVLSLFLVDQDLTQVDAIMAARIATKDRLDRYDGLLFSTDLLHKLAIRTAQTPGETKHMLVDKVHVDLVELKFGQLIGLVYEICRSPLTRYLTASKPRLAHALCAAVDQGHYPAGHPKESILNEARRLAAAHPGSAPLSDHLSNPPGDR